MMNTIRMMEDRTLSFVAGGNDGDSKFEHDRGVVLYKVGDTVEVFESGWHIMTKRGTIIEVGTKNIHPSIWNTSRLDVPAYLVKFEDGHEKWVVSNDIER